MAQAKRSVSASNARGQWSSLVNRAAYGHERVIISNRGKDLVALISAEDLEHFERLEQEAQDRQDMADAEAAIQEAEQVGYRSFDEVAARLGL